MEYGAVAVIVIGLIGWMVWSVMKAGSRCSREEEKNPPFEDRR